MRVFRYNEDNMESALQHGTLYYRLDSRVRDGEICRRGTCFYAASKIIRTVMLQ